jgi:hypothetical protein
MYGLLLFVLILCALPFFIFQALFFLSIPFQRVALYFLVRVMAHFFSQENELSPDQLETANRELWADFADQVKKGKE